jgi:hypothetical protein
MTSETQARTVQHARVTAGSQRWAASTTWLQRRPLLLPARFALLAFAVRSVGLIRSFELWGDEIIYAQLGVSASRGELPNLADGHFFLHPPVFFFIEGGIIQALGLPTGDSMNLVFDLRWVNAVLGALTVALAFLLVRRVAGTVSACFTGIVLAFDPFVLRNNSRVFLETPAGVFVLGGLLVLVSCLQRERPGRDPRLVAAGLLMGCAVLTKDSLVFSTMVPVLLAMGWRKTLAWRQGVIVLVATAVPYGVYLVLISAAGYFPAWAWAKSHGLLRLIGHTQETGFNAPHAPSLVERLVVELGHYGTSYALLLACLPAGLLLSLAARPDRRLIGLLAVAVGLLGLYLALFGTFEEQYGYAVMVASAVALGACVAEISERWPVRQTAVVGVGALRVVLTVVLGARLETSTDNGFQSFRAWAASNLPGDARVAVINSTTELAFQDDPRFGLWTTASALQEHQAHYILTMSLPTVQGYTNMSPQMLDWLTQHATPVYTVAGATNGETVLWYLNQATLDQAVRLGVGDERPTGPR